MAEKSSFQKYLNEDNLDGTVWVGKVIDNEDPTYSGRCRVRVYGKFDGTVNMDDPKSGFSIPDDQIPWCYPVGSTIFGGGDSKGAGSLSVPKIDTKVKVMFSGGNIYAPEYVAIQDVNASLINEIKSSYQNAHVLFFDEDENVKVLYTVERGIEMFHKDSHIVINPDSSITIEHKESKSIIELVGDKINIVSQKEINVTGESTVNVTTKTCVIDSTKDVTIITKKCKIESPKIELGKAAAEAVMKGNTFQALFNAHMHIGNLGAPTGPPIVPLTGAELSRVTKTE